MGLAKPGHGSGLQVEALSPSVSHHEAAQVPAGAHPGSMVMGAVTEVAPEKRPRMDLFSGCI